MTRFELATLTLARCFGQLCYLRLSAKSSIYKVFYLPSTHIVFHGLLTSRGLAAA